MMQLARIYHLKALLLLVGTLRIIFYFEVRNITIVTQSHCCAMERQHSPLPVTWYRLTNLSSCHILSHLSPLMSMVLFPASVKSTLESTYGKIMRYLSSCGWFISPNMSAEFIRITGFQLFKGPIIFYHTHMHIWHCILVCMCVA